MSHTTTRAPGRIAALGVSIAIAAVLAASAIAAPEAHASLTAGDAPGLSVQQAPMMTLDGVTTSAKSSKPGQVTMTWKVGKLPYCPDYANKTVLVECLTPGEWPTPICAKLVKLRADGTGSVTFKGIGHQGEDVAMRLKMNGYIGTDWYGTGWTAPKLVRVLASPDAPTSIKAARASRSKVAVSWKAGAMNGCKSPTWTVRYSYDRSMKSAKSVTVKKRSATLKSLKGSKTVYVQVRANAKYDGKAVHSRWSKKKAVKAM